MPGARLTVAILLCLSGVAVIALGFVVSWMAGVLVLVGSINAYIGSTKINVDKPKKPEQLTGEVQ